MHLPENLRAITLITINYFGWYTVIMCNLESNYGMHVVMSAHVCTKTDSVMKYSALRQCHSETANSIDSGAHKGKASESC